MANVAVIVDDRGRVVRVEKRDAPLWRSGYAVVKAFGDARVLARGDPVGKVIITRDLEYQQRRHYADEIRASNQFTDEQKEEWYTLLSGRVFALDYYTVERGHGGAEATDPGPVPPPDQTVITGTFDP